MNATWVYKVVSQAEWDAARAAGCYAGSADDQRDGFIHLSLREQLVGTLSRHFAGRTGLLLLELPATDLGAALRFEPSRGGALFPHLYGTLDPARVTRLFPLSIVEGVHVLPDDLR